MPEKTTVSIVFDCGPFGSVTWEIPRQHLKGVSEQATALKIKMRLEPIIRRMTAFFLLIQNCQNATAADRALSRLDEHLFNGSKKVRQSAG